MKTSYDKSTDSLYVELRPLPSARTVEIEEDVMLDIGEDGQPVGYDIQHASTKREFIARLILDETQAAAE
jgi:uncharacterized protein YuzE